MSGHVSVFLELMGETAITGVPQAQCMIEPPGHHETTIRRELDIHDRSGVPTELGDRAIGRVYLAGNVVEPVDRETLSLRGEPDVEHGRPVEEDTGLPRRRIPDVYHSTRVADQDVVIVAGARKDVGDA